MLNEFLEDEYYGRLITYLKRLFSGKETNPEIIGFKECLGESWDKLAELRNLYMDSFKYTKDKELMVCLEELEGKTLVLVTKNFGYDDDKEEKVEDDVALYNVNKITLEENYIGDTIEYVDDACVMVEGISLSIDNGYNTIWFNDKCAVGLNYFSQYKDVIVLPGNVFFHTVIGIVNDASIGITKIDIPEFLDKLRNLRNGEDIELTDRFIKAGKAFDERRQQYENFYKDALKALVEPLYSYEYSKFMLPVLDSLDECAKKGITDPYIMIEYKYGGAYIVSRGASFNEETKELVLKKAYFYCSLEDWMNDTECQVYSKKTLYPSPLHYEPIQVFGTEEEYLAYKEKVIEHEKKYNGID